MIPLGEFGPPFLTYKATAAARTALQVDAGSFHFAAIHQTLTWTTGSLTCICDHSYACVYTRGLGTPTMSHNNIFDSEKLSQIFEHAHIVRTFHCGLPCIFGPRAVKGSLFLSLD